MRRSFPGAITLVLACALPLAGQTASPVNFAALTPRTDSFVVVVQGNPMGYQRITLARTDSGFRIVDDVQIGSIMTQHTEVEFGLDGELRSTKQSGQVRGQEMKIEIAYASGRAKGSATAPTMTGMLTTAIDTTVAAGAIDDNLIMAVLPGFAWAPGATFALPVFLSGKGHVAEFTLAVTGTDSVTVPAGTFEAYRIEISGGQAPVAMYVSTAQPHRLVKVAPRGAPLEFVLAQ